MALPGFLKKYFWDVEFEKVDSKKHSKDILGRILEYGDEEAARWMLQNFPKNKILDTLTTSRMLSVKSANFWALILNVKKEKVKCLSKSFQETRKKFWPY